MQDEAQREAVDLGEGRAWTSCAEVSPEKRDDRTAPQSGSPMTYLVDGRQYLVVAISGGNYSGELLALKLPD